MERGVGIRMWRRKTRENIKKKKCMDEKNKEKKEK